MDLVSGQGIVNQSYNKDLEDIDPDYQNKTISHNYDLPPTAVKSKEIKMIDNLSPSQQIVNNKQQVPWNQR